MSGICKYFKWCENGNIVHEMIDALIYCTCEMFNWHMSKTDLKGDYTTEDQSNAHEKI